MLPSPGSSFVHGRDEARHTLPLEDADLTVLFTLISLNNIFDSAAFSTLPARVLGSLPTTCLFSELPTDKQTIFFGEVAGTAFAAVTQKQLPSLFFFRKVDRGQRGC